MAADREACIAAGMNDHVAKPIEPEILFSTLLKWIPARAAPGAAALRPTKSRPKPEVDVRLPEIEGLDTTTGLRRVVGKKGFYVSLLRRFCVDQRATPQRLRAALDEGAMDEAELLAHTLKGLAGNIGMAAIQDQAAALELAVQKRAEMAQLGTLVQALEKVLQPFVAAVAEQLPTQAAVAVDPNVDRGTVTRICSELAHLLADNNLEAGDLMADHETLLHSAFGLDFEPVATAVRNFDFDAALAQLQSLAALQGYTLVTAGETP
jgi:two-component system sensor histidine kinase/response regulator